MSMELKKFETAWAGKTCLCFDALESTNDYGKILSGKQKVHGTLIFADTQTAGKGRRGRVWESPKGSSVSMSLCLEPKLPTEKAAGLTLVMALSVASAIEEVTGASPKIKWPNDIVLNGKKICGILTEMFLREEDYVVIIGVGINVNVLEFPPEIREIASSLRLECGCEISREALMEAAMKYFETYYEQYEACGDFSLLKEPYEARLANRGNQVKVLDPKEPFEGIARGIDDLGNLLVLCEDGSTKSVCSGEVSVRGLYGYV